MLNNGKLLRNFCSENNEIKQNFPIQPQRFNSKGHAMLDIIKDDYKTICKISESQEFPVLERKPEKVLIENWWSERPFPINKPLNVPIFNFQTGQYTGKVVELDKNIFNVPLRRDLIHRAYKYLRFKGYVRTNRGKNISTVSGSNKKAFPQKKISRARQGQKRAPRMRGGVLAHPRKMQIMEYYPQNRKVMLQAQKALLSARLAEGKIRIVDSETVESPKTRLVQDAIDNMTLGHRETFLLITGYKFCSNYKLAQRNLKSIKNSFPNELDVLEILKMNKLVFTVEGLRSVCELLTDRTFRDYAHNFYTNQKKELKSEKTLRLMREANGKGEEEKPVYDPAKPLKFKFRVQKEYYEEYEKKRLQDISEDKNAVFNNPAIVDKNTADPL